MSSTDLPYRDNLITVKGKLDLHGVKKKIEVKGIMKYEEARRSSLT